ncbi:MAG: class I SAM-dependent methyltransferase family protein [archaeon]|nr:MAG: class I SAM-dependent methyltransferase family protein [archaeon]
MPRLIRAALARSGIKADLPSTGVDVIGDIAILRLPGLRAKEKRSFAEALCEESGSIKVVFEQEGGIEGKHRLRRLRHLTGEKRSTTVHKENGCSYRLDVAKCYFSPRLSTERERIASEVRKKERVLNMFAGVGPFSIPIAKVAGARVVSCEVNPSACRYHEENNRLNKVQDLVTLIRGDAADLPEVVTGKFDRVLMPHPSEADRFLEVALSMCKRDGLVHYYRHVLGKDERDAGRALKGELSGLLPPKTRFTVRRVRDVGPRWVEMAAEIRLRN